MHRLSRAVIIIDEVQSIPMKCVYLFNLAMNFLSQICGSTIVLCSATQPPFDMLEAFPLKLDGNSSMTGDTQHDFEAFRRTKLQYMPKKGGYNMENGIVYKGGYGIETLYLSVPSIYDSAYCLRQYFFIGC